jgi:hypothetical protein
MLPLSLMATHANGYTVHEPLALGYSMMARPLFFLHRVPLNALPLLLASLLAP